MARSSSTWRKRGALASLRVAVVAKRDDTLSRLGDFLRTQGMDAAGYSDLAQAAAKPTDAFIVFTDDLDEAVVRAWLDLSTTTRAGPFNLLVTAHRSRWSGIVARGRSPNPPLIVERPVWGFTLVEALRAELASRI